MFTLFQKRNFDVFSIGESILKIKRKTDYSLYIEILFSILTSVILLYYLSKDIPMWLIFILSVFMILFLWTLYKTSSQTLPRNFTFERDLNIVTYGKEYVLFDKIRSVEIATYPQMFYSDSGIYFNKWNYYSLRLKCYDAPDLIIDSQGAKVEVQEVAKLIASFINKPIITTY